MRWWIGVAFLCLGTRTGAQAPVREAPEREALEREALEREAPSVDEAHVRRLEAVGLAASEEAQRTLDARVLPFDLTWGLP
jgi:hypothetical protein